MSIQREPLNYSMRLYNNIKPLFLKRVLKHINKAEHHLDLEERQWLAKLAVAFASCFAMRKSIQLGFSYLDRFLTPNHSLKKISGVLDEQNSAIRDTFARNSLKHLKTLCKSNNFRTIEDAFWVCRIANESSLLEKPETFFKDVTVQAIKLTLQQRFARFNDDLLMIIESFISGADVLIPGAGEGNSRKRRRSDH